MAGPVAKPTETSDSSSGEGSGSGIVVVPYIEKLAEKDPFPKRAWDSFKRDPDAHITKKGQVGANGLVFDLESAAQSTAESGLARKLKGTGLFVGSGKALQQGGPASLLIAFSLIGAMLFCTVQALGEMAVLLPVAGSFSAYSTRFLDPAWGFAMGWNYALQWLIVLPLEIVAAAITVEYWNSPVSPAAWVTVFLVAILSINLFGVRAYGEAEFVFSIVKVIAVIGFIILGIILNIGGGKNGDYIGGRYWANPGGFNNADRRLIGQSSSDAKSSPFVIAIKNAGIDGLDSVMNVVIMISVISVGNSSVYGSSRTLAALAEQGQAPKFLAYIDREGRPLKAIGVASSFGFLAYLAASGKETEVFVWLQALSGLSSIFTWGSICLAHIRFRRAWRIQGHSLEELAFRSQAGVVGSWIGFIFNVLVLIAQFWTGFSPVKPQYGPPITGTSALVVNFFQAYLAVPVVLICYVTYKIIYRTPFMRCKNMDLKTGVRDLNLAELLWDEKQERASWPKWKKAYKFLC
ncbi:MAG: hypothetical protein Q9208_004917 [Pyrenodesmia sp. 3 TL-2023]